MNKYKIIFDKILSGEKDDSIPLCNAADLLQKLGFDERINGLNHVFISPENNEKLIITSNGIYLDKKDVIEIRKFIKNNYKTTKLLTA